MIEIIVPQNKQKERIDKFLTHELSDFSRSRIQQLIDEEKITINGFPTKANHRVKTSELIRIVIPTPKKLELLPQNIPLKIVFEDTYLIVVNKEAGMVVHPAFGNYSGTLVNALLYHCKNLSSVNDYLRPGIVHRLDKDTSGLLVVAKDDVSHRRLAEQFMNRTIKREYLTIVWGLMKEESGRIEMCLARSRKDRTKMIIQSEGKLAITNYQVLEDHRICSLLKIKLETGRTHQIRAHMSHLGHPVVGDPTYGGRHKSILGLSQKDRRYGIQMLKMMPRQALHARCIGFIHPISQKWLYFESELPNDMEALLKWIKSNDVNFQA